jgi:glycosyltransferase involved in cell wall biosynthesis
LLRHLAQLLKSENIDLMHSFTIKAAVYGSLAARWAGVPRRVDAVAGMGYVFSSNEFRARVLRPFVKLALKLAFAGANARLILQNPDDVHFFRSHSLVAAEKIRLILGSGVDCSRFSPSLAEKRGTPVPVVLFAARLLWDKGLQELIDAIRQLHSLGIEARFLVAGEPDDGNPAVVSPTQVSAWTDEGLIEWLGHVEDMPSLYNSVDIVVLPSYREGLPKGLIEAAACAKPLIATDVPGCRVVVEDGVNGLLVKPRDSTSLAKAMERLISDGTARLAMGRAGREKVLAQFEEQIVNRQTLAVYRELAEGE